MPGTPAIRPRWPSPTTPESRWRNRNEFLVGRPAIITFLTRKWTREHDYRLIKELWSFTCNRIAVRFAYEYRDDAGEWFRAYGNENWDFDADGLMQARHASINDLAITEADRKFHWDRSGSKTCGPPRIVRFGPLISLCVQGRVGPLERLSPPLSCGPVSAGNGHGSAYAIAREKCNDTHRVHTVVVGINALRAWLRRLLPIADSSSVSSSCG